MGKNSLVSFISPYRHFGCRLAAAIIDMHVDASDIGDSIRNVALINITSVKTASSNLFYVDLSLAVGLLYSCFVAGSKKRLV